MDALLNPRNIFLLYRKTPETDKILAEELEKEKAKSSRIRCPFCQWQPKASSIWYCGDCDYPEFYFAGCGTAWNTFDTKGVCPGCAHQWRNTSCLRCGEWSPHEEWYECEEEN